MLPGRLDGPIAFSAAQPDYNPQRLYLLRSVIFLPKESGLLYVLLFVSFDVLPGSMLQYYRSRCVLLQSRYVGISLLIIRNVNCGPVARCFSASFTSEENPFGTSILADPCHNQVLLIMAFGKISLYTRSAGLWTPGM